MTFPVRGQTGPREVPAHVSTTVITGANWLLLFAMMRYLPVAVSISLYLVSVALMIFVLRVPTDRRVTSMDATLVALSHSVSLAGALLLLGSNLRDWAWFLPIVVLAASVSLVLEGRRDKYWPSAS